MGGCHEPAPSIIIPGSDMLAAPSAHDQPLEDITPWMLPELTVNQDFMAAFITADTPCLALGIAEVENRRCALIALRLGQPIPPTIAAAGFAFGHALLGADTWEV